MRTNKENAVSPVVGVMLMLVVVIIVAAIVSAFAGNMVQTSKQSPQATINGVFYVNGTSNFVVLTHKGGDELSTSKISIILKRGDDWGTVAGLQYGDYIVNKTLVHDISGNYWFRMNGNNPVQVWRAGEVVTYDLFSSGSSANTLSSTDVGKSLELQVTTTDGKLISKSKVPVVS